MERRSLTDAVFASVVAETATSVRGGGVIVYPTDTVYGLGCDPTNARAVRRIQKMKGRPEAIRFIVLASDEQMIEPWIRPLAPAMASAVSRCMPGPVTFIFHSSARALERIVGCGTTLAVRVPEHRFCVEVCRAIGLPLLSTSANVHGADAPADIADIDRGILASADLVVDGGRLSELPSTIVDVTGTVPRIVREGAFPRTALQMRFGPHNGID